MDYIFRDAIDEIDSFESIYSNVIFRNNNLVIPYINIGLLEHPFNKGSGEIFVDFSYMVFIDVRFLSIYIEKMDTFKVIGDSPGQEEYNLGVFI